MNKTTENGATPLHAAAHNGHERVIKLLLDHGADPVAVDEDGWTAVFSVAVNGHESIVKLLLDRGADAKKFTENGSTPLHAAAQNGHEGVHYDDFKAIRLWIRESGHSQRPQVRPCQPAATTSLYACLDHVLSTRLSGCFRARMQSSLVRQSGGHCFSARCIEL